MKKLIFFVALTTIGNFCYGQTIHTINLTKTKVENNVINEVLNFCQRRIGYTSKSIIDSKITAKEELKFIHENIDSLQNRDINFLKCANFTVEQNGEKLDLAVTEINFKNVQSQNRIYDFLVKKNSNTLNGEILTRYIFFKRNLSIVICYTQEINNEKTERLFKEMLRKYKK